jgi:serine/threonine-protein kinase PknK
MDRIAEELTLVGYANPVEIGRGGMGVVFRAQQVEFGRAVAIKVLAPFPNESAKKRFERERRAIGQVSNHPNIVTVYGSGFTTDDRPFIAMEYMPGGSLADRLRQGPMRWEDAIATGVKLSDALQTAHRASVLHRDVKPENILVSAFGQPKLADFGIARIDDGHETRTSTVTFSLAYAPPEAFDGKRLTASADVYALACSLYALVAGQPPFVHSSDESIVSIIARVASAPVPDLRLLGVPAALAAAIEAAMIKDPTRRTQSATAFRDQLQAVKDEPTRGLATAALDSEPPRARSVVLGTTPSTDHAQSKQGEPAVNQRADTRPAFPWSLLIAVLLAVAVIAAVALYALTRPSPPRPADNSSLAARCPSGFAGVSHLASHRLGGVISCTAL